MNYKLSYLVKILVAGESFVGKTTLIQRYIADEFIVGIRNTIGVDFFLKQITDVQFEGLSDDHLDLQIWDISGESRFREILPLYSAGTHGVILCFNDIPSFQKLEDWETLLQKIIPPPIPRILLRTKSDLDEEIPDEWEIEDFMKKFKCVGFYSTSAKDGTGVTTAFLSMAKEIYSNLIKTYGKQE